MSFGEPILEDIVDVPRMASPPVDPSLRVCSNVFHYSGREIESMLRYFVGSDLFTAWAHFIGFFRDLDELAIEVEVVDVRCFSFFPLFALIRSNGFGDFIFLGPSPVTSEEYRFPKNLPQK